MASTLLLYGFEPHETGNNSGIVRLWVGPSGMKIENECRERNQNFVQRQELISPCNCMSRLGDFLDVFAAYHIFEPSRKLGKGDD
ncbi:hypothetical protein DPMN_175374 [Dreissena polymorpha]|uniref:Uncharacterized protein n=1 Tax=Dreissena polymorpha TaxID=45954 RepID=A0A9D4IJJ0_DREPO|nr:hypothetical protein DPMN_175374 [Dreissena polymorpha]